MRLINSAEFPQLHLQKFWNVITQQVENRGKREPRLKRTKMGSEGEITRKPRFLCLHGFRTSGEIHKKQVGKWPQSVLEKLDLVYLDAPFPAQGKSDVEGIFDPPYYEWFQFNKVC